MNSLDAGMEMSHFLNSPGQHDASSSYSSLYGLPPNGLGMAAPFDGMSPGAAWPFAMPPMGGGDQASMAPPHGMMPLGAEYEPMGAPTGLGLSTPARHASGTVPGTAMQGTAMPTASPRPAPPTTPAAQSSASASASASTSASTSAAPLSSAPSDEASTSRSAAGRRRTPAKGEKDSKTGRRKIKIEFIDDDSRRHITFSKRKAGIMKKAYELATLTGTQVLLLVVSQTGLVYTFTTPKLEAVVKEPEGRQLIQECLNAPDPAGSGTTSGPSSSAHPTGMPAAPVKDEVYADADDDGDADENDEDDSAFDLSRPDPGFTAQAMGTAPSLRPNGAPLFHPGWAPTPFMGAQHADPRHAHAAMLKRRRTQPNLSAAAMSNLSPSNDMPASPMYPTPPLMAMPAMPSTPGAAQPQQMPNPMMMYYGANAMNTHAATPHQTSQSSGPSGQDAAAMAASTPPS